MRGPLIETAKHHPDVKINATLRPQRHPYVEATYGKGRSR